VMSLPYFKLLLHTAQIDITCLGLFTRTISEFDFALALEG